VNRLEQQTPGTFFFIDAIWQVLMVGMEPKIPLILNPHLLPLFFLQILQFLRHHLSIVPTPLPFFEAKVVIPKIKIVLISLNLGGIINIFLAFGRNV
jgi:hypothetical protein